MQRIVACCSVSQCVAVCRSVFCMLGLLNVDLESFLCEDSSLNRRFRELSSHKACRIHCDTLQYTATHCNTLQHTATWAFKCRFRELSSHKKSYIFIRTKVTYMQTRPSHKRDLHSRRRSDLKYLDLQIIQFSWILC